MYTGTLITDLLAAVERAETFASQPQPESPRPQSPSLESKNSPASSVEAQADVFQPGRASLEPEQFPQPFGLSAADRNLSLLLVVHAQLVGALEPGNDFADTVDVHQVGAVGPPKKIRV